MGSNIAFIHYQAFLISFNSLVNFEYKFNNLGTVF